MKVQSGYRAAASRRLPKPLSPESLSLMTLATILKEAITLYLLEDKEAASDTLATAMTGSFRGRKVRFIDPYYA